MSEEEIIEIIKDFLELREIHSSDSMTKSYLSVYKQVIQGLLDLYQKEKEKNKDIEATLKQTQDSWYEDTKKIELNNECEIALNNRIIDLENELNKEKEKNKELEDKCIELSTTIDALETDLTEEKEKNRELERYKKYYEIERVVWNRKDYISKDKIKETFDNYSESSLMLNNTFIEFKKDLLGEEYGNIKKEKYKNY